MPSVGAASLSLLNEAATQPFEARGIFRDGGASLSTLANKDSFSFTDGGAKFGH